MGRMDWHFPLARSGPRRTRGAALALCAVLASARPGFAQDLTFTAKVDQTTVEVGDTLALTLTITGELSGAAITPLQLPEGVVVLGRSQATNFAVRGGLIERAGLPVTFFRFNPQVQNLNLVGNRTHSTWNAMKLTVGRRLRSGLFRRGRWRELGVLFSHTINK